MTVGDSFWTLFRRAPEKKKVFEPEYALISVHGAQLQVGWTSRSVDPALATIDVSGIVILGTLAEPHSGPVSVSEGVRILRLPNGSVLTSPF